MIVYGYGSVYAWLLSIWCGSFIVRLSVMVIAFYPFNFVNASLRIWSILGLSNVERAFSFATI